MVTKCLKNMDRMIAKDIHQDMSFFVMCAVTS